MLEGKPLLFKHFKNFTSKANLRIHHVFLNAHYSKALLASYTCDYILRLTRCALNNHCSRILRLVGIADINRYTFLADRKYGFIMEHSRTHVRKLSQFFICYSHNRLRIVNDSRIRNKEARYICPVLVKVSLDCSCDNSTCYV